MRSIKKSNFYICYLKKNLRVHIATAIIFRKVLETYLFKCHFRITDKKHLSSNLTRNVDLFLLQMVSVSHIESKGNCGSLKPVKEMTHAILIIHSTARNKYLICGAY